uniref:Uncharacterized protein n=1 Tax=Aliivibrio wodanis TaxID=80852 RepID=A0A5Q4ZLY1_9GAMM|nr:hypothetical protein AW0309160_00219 [Aliivibrio wodanis]
MRSKNEIVERIKSLRVANMSGKRLAIIGYELSTYEQFYYFDGALEITLFDSLECENDMKSFLENWKREDSQFDIIIMLYSDELNVIYSNLLHLSLLKLSPSSLLCVDFPKNNRWLFGVKDRQARVFNLLNDFAKKVINSHGRRLTAGCDSSCVYHIQVKKSYVFLLTGSPGTGKSTLASSCFSASELPIISGDKTYKDIFEGRVAINKQSESVIKEDFQPNRIYRLTQRLLESQLEAELVACWVDLAKHQSFVLDSCIPSIFLEKVELEFKRQGYIPVRLNWESEPTMEMEDLTRQKVSQFSKQLTKGTSLLRGLLYKNNR